MARNLYNSLLHIWLDEMTLFNNYFFRNLFVNGFLNLNYCSLWFLAITMVNAINRFLDQNLNNFCNLDSLNNRFFDLYKLNFFLDNNMVNWSIDNFEFRFFINFGNSLFNFEYFTNFFVDIFWYFLFNFDLSCFYFRSMIRNLNFSNNLFWYKHLFT